MNHKHRKVLHQIFAHPEPANISPADVNAVLVELGAELAERQGDKFSVTLGGHTVVFHHASHALSKDEVRHLRKFLQACEISPERDYPL